MLTEKGWFGFGVLINRTGTQPLFYDLCFENEVCRKKRGKEEG